MIIAAVLAVCWGIVAAGPASAASSGLPGGRPYYVVTLGKLAAKAGDNWNRLAFYRFVADATGTGGDAYEGYWFWQFRPGQPNESTTAGVATCPYGCPFYASSSYAHGGPKQLHGRYTISGSWVTVVWDDVQHSQETWAVSSGASYAELSLVSSTYHVSVGHGYGSAKAYDTGATMSAIYSSVRSGLALSGKQTQWVYGTVGAGVVNQTAVATGPLRLNQPALRSCGRTCMTIDSGSQTDGGTTYYFENLGGTALPRKDAEEMFRNSHRNGKTRCYVNSVILAHPHLVPSLQIIGDDGSWKGWVQVETSMWATWPTDPTYMGVSWYAAP